MADEAVTTVPAAKKRGCGFWIMVVLAAIGALVILTAIFGPTPEEEKAQAAADVAKAEVEAVKVTARELFRAYEANEVAAQSQYGDRPLLVTGTIDRIALDFSDDPFIAFKSDNQFMSPQADLADEDKAKVGALAEGQEVTVLCMRVSEIAGTPMLNDCRLR